LFLGVDFGEVGERAGPVELFVVRPSSSGPACCWACGPG